MTSLISTTKQHDFKVTDKYDEQFQSFYFFQVLSEIMSYEPEHIASMLFKRINRAKSVQLLLRIT